MLPQHGMRASDAPEEKKKARGNTRGPFPGYKLLNQVQTGVTLPPRASNSAFGIGNAVLYASVAVCAG
jgi:hypothetical protein